MVEENHTMKHEFILTGFTDYPEMKALLFVVFFVIYLITMVGNMGLMILISKERSLHTPMYIFLGNLALVDSCCACAITPKMLGNFFSQDRIISLYECMAQFYFLCTVETADCFLLAAMAYDRYVAICNPLQYHTMMSKKLCLQMTTGAFIAGNLHSMIHVGLLFRLAFCGSNHINHFYCDILPFYRLSCVDPYVNELCHQSINIIPLPVACSLPEIPLPTCPTLFDNSRMHNIPVYKDITHGNREMTVIRKVKGNIWALQKEVEEFLSPQLGRTPITQINDVTGTLRIKGCFDEQLKAWLLEKGF
ncbi:Olfactory receptor 5K1 [Microtus ochrogaster]|uniref:Olfactory receptor n=1 Tax=Microtus ochrogaster TaxID=79684 RepID=A0A8J6GRN2_MICOH|nr:Olfactory receptor 5K1 [Microtus ochrogaster]